MNITQRLANLETKLGTSTQRPKTLLINFVDTDDTGEVISTGGILSVYDPTQTTEYRLTADQVGLYDNDQLDLAKLTPHNVVEY